MTPGHGPTSNAGRFLAYAAVGAGSALLTGFLVRRQIALEGFSPLPLLASVGVPAAVAVDFHHAVLPAMLAGYAGQWVAGSLMVCLLSSLGTPEPVLQMAEANHGGPSIEGPAGSP